VRLVLVMMINYFPKVVWNYINIGICNFVFLDDVNLNGRMKFRGSLMMKEHSSKKSFTMMKEQSSKKTFLQELGRIRLIFLVFDAVPYLYL
jgi:hypothetical protein